MDWLNKCIGYCLKVSGIVLSQYTKKEPHMFARLSAFLLATGALLALIALATLATKFAPASAARTPQAFDAARQVLFVAHTNDGAVRVLNLRNTIGEIGMLRASARHDVHDLRLDASGHRLWVLGDDAVYCYDALSLRSLSSTPLQPGHAQRFARVDTDTFSLAPQMLSATSNGSHLE
jgi:6-phosphogluconolactonase (cycloisomerase 2 family)